MVWFRFDAIMTYVWLLNVVVGTFRFIYLPLTLDLSFVNYIPLIVLFFVSELMFVYNVVMYSRRENEWSFIDGGFFS